MRPALLLRRLCEVALVVTIVSQLTIVVLNVALRSLFHGGFVWANETATLALTVMAFIGGALAYDRGAHLGVAVILNRLDAHQRPRVQASLDWLVLAIAVVVLVTSIPVVQNHSHQNSPLLGVNQLWFVLPLPIGMLVLALFALCRLLTMNGRTVAASGLTLAALVAMAYASRPMWLGKLPAGAPLTVSLLAFFLLSVTGLPVGFALIAGTFAYLVVGSLSLVSLPSIMLSGVDLYVLLALPFFILAGFIMEKGGISERLVGFIGAVVGHFRGGLLHVTVLSMYLVSGMSGAKTADIAAVGGVMCDMLRREGYDDAETVAVLATSAVMGETVPPSIAMLVLASITSLSVAALFVAGLVPAAVVALCLMSMVWLNARQRRIAPKPRARWSTIGRAAVRAFLPLLMPLLLFGGIISGIATPTEVSSFAVVYGLVLAVAVFHALSWRAVIDMVIESAVVTGMLLFVVGAAAAFAYVLTISNLPSRLLDILGTLHGGTVLFLALSLAILIVMGMLLEGLPALLIFGPLLLPIGARFGVDPLHFAVMLIIAMGIGLFSPPFGIGLYVACAVGGCTIERATRPILPYLAVLFAGLVIIAAVPALTLALPRAFHVGTP